MANVCGAKQQEKREIVECSKERNPFRNVHTKGKFSMALVEDSVTGMRYPPLKYFVASGAQRVSRSRDESSTLELGMGMHEATRATHVVDDTLKASTL